MCSIKLESNQVDINGNVNPSLILFVDEMTKLLLQESKMDVKKGATKILVKAKAVRMDTGYFNRDIIYFQPIILKPMTLKIGEEIVLYCGYEEYTGLYAGKCKHTSNLILVFDYLISDSIELNFIYKIRFSNCYDINSRMSAYLKVLKTDKYCNHPLLQSRFSDDTDESAIADSLKLLTINTKKEASSDLNDIDINTQSLVFRQQLNKSQQQAVVDVLQENMPLRVIHGPPGTGKTTVLVELLMNLCIDRGKRMLCCGPSNKSVDHMLTTLISKMTCKCKTCPQCIISIIRYGHPVRIDSNLHVYSLDDKLFQIDRFLCRRYKEKAIEKYMKKRRFIISRQIVQNSLMVFSTLASAAMNYRNYSDQSDSMFGKFDYVFIDECGQAIEAICWAALTAGKRAVLFGDHLQLPPTVQSKGELCKVLKISLLEQMVKRNPACVSLLNMQYRMNDKIANWSSHKFYDGLLQSHESVASRTIKDVIRDTSNLFTCEPLALIDTTSTKESRVGSSWRNLDECEYVNDYVNSLLNAGIKPKNIGVITPYMAQQTQLRTLLNRDIYVSTVDGFQGQEKDIIILSTVRISRFSEFISDAQRLNVAITRSRLQFVLVGSLSNLVYMDIFKHLIVYMMSAGAVSIDLRDSKSILERFQNLSIKLEIESQTNLTSTHQSENHVF